MMRQINLSSLLYNVRNRTVGSLTLLLRSDNAAINAARAAACRFAAYRLRKRKTTWAARAAEALEKEANQFFRGDPDVDVVVSEEDIEAAEVTTIESQTYPSYCVVRPRNRR